MGHKLKSSSSFLTALLVVVMVTLLAGIIVLTYFFAPEKPSAPPVSVLKYEAPPSLQTVSYRFDDSLELDSTDGMDFNIEVQYEPTDSDHLIKGIITNKVSGEPLRKAIIEASWELTDEENLAYQAQLNEAMEIEEGDRWETINELDRNYEKGRSARSSRDGSYNIYVPNDRPITVTYRRQGFIPAQYEDVELDIDEPSTTLNIALDVGALISGRVTEEDTGKPIFGMPININRVKNGQAVHSYQDYGYGYGYSYETDEDGVYSIYGLVPGEYEVGVYLNDSRYQEGTVLPYKRVTLTAPDEKLKNVDFQLARAGVVWGYTIDPDTDMGTSVSLILVTSENPIAQGINAMFTAFKNQEEPEFFGTNSSKKRDGYYEIGGVPFNKEYRVYATGNDSAPQLSDPFIITPDQPDIRVDINMFNGSDLYGRVVDSDYNPVPGAEVTCIPSFTELFSPLNSAMAMQNDKTNEEGYFELKGIPQGNYQMFAFKEGFKYSARGVPVFTDGFTDVTGLVVLLDPVDSGEHLIYGTVTNSRGDPVANASIQLAGITGAELGGLEVSANTNDSGEFVFENMSIGKYFMHVTADGGYASKNVTKVYLDKPNIIKLQSGALFRGTVLVKETGRAPTSGTRVNAKQNLEFSQGLLSALENTNFDEGYSHIDDDSGQFEMFLNPGDYVIQVSHKDYISGQISVKLGPDDIKSGTIYLSKTGGTIEGTVRTRDSQSPQGARVSLQRVTQTDDSLLGNLVDVESLFSGQSTRVDSDGKFFFDSLPSGNYVAYAQHRNYANGQSDPIPLPDNASATGVNIWLTQGGKIEGYVTNRGRPSSDAVVMLISTTSPISASTDSNGFYYFEGISPGTHHLQVVGADMLGNIADITNVDQDLGSERVVVREGQVTRFDIRK
jgi:hypothetical protein